VSQIAGMGRHIGTALDALRSDRYLSTLVVPTSHPAITMPT
jgi:hypothetical protein